MKILFFIITTYIMLSSSFYNDSLDSSREYVLETKNTNPDAKYSITISGQYSQWSNSTEIGKGNDAVWYNDKPNFNNPIIDNYLEDVFKNPIWYGDSTNFNIPFSGISFSMIDYIGFRLNNQPLPKFDLDLENHAYTFEVNGNGNPLKFEIWDYVFNANTNNREPRYGDNVGKLYVQVEEIIADQPQNCGFEILEKYDDGIKVLLRAKIVDQDQLEIIANGNHVDSYEVICSDTLRLFTQSYFLIDNSYSMNNPVSFEDDRSKKEMLVDLLKLNKTILDQSDFYFFSENSVIKSSIDEFETLPARGNTKLLSSISALIDISAYGSNLIFISDSYTDETELVLDSLKDKLKQRNDLNVQGLLVLENSFDLDQESFNKFLDLSNQFENFQIRTFANSNQLFNYFTFYQEFIFDDECCSIIFDLECGSSTDLNEIELSSGNYIYNYEIPCSKSSIKKKIQKVYSNKDQLEIGKSQLYDLNGNNVSDKDPSYLINGIYLLYDPSNNKCTIINLGDK